MDKLSKLKLFLYPCHLPLINLKSALGVVPELTTLNKISSLSFCYNRSCDHLSTSTEHTCNYFAQYIIAKRCPANYFDILVTYCNWFLITVALSVAETKVNLANDNVSKYYIDWEETEFKKRWLSLL